MSIPTVTFVSPDVNIPSDGLVQGAIKSSSAGLEYYDGTKWMIIDQSMWGVVPQQGPTQQELEDHPSLKNAWEEYLTIRRLLGLYV